MYYIDFGFTKNLHLNQNALQIFRTFADISTLREVGAETFKNLKHLKSM